MVRTQNPGLPGAPGFAPGMKGELIPASATQELHKRHSKIVPKRANSCHESGTIARASFPTFPIWVGNFGKSGKREIGGMSHVVPKTRDISGQSGTFLTALSAFWRGRW